MDIFQNKHSIDTSLKYLKKFYINFSLARMCILQSIPIIGNKEMRKHYAFTDIRKEE